MDEDARKRGRKAINSARLTNSLVAKQGRPSREQTLWDNQLPGFGLRVRVSGHSSFIVSYRSPRTGKQCRQTVGNALRLSVEEARSSARTVLARIELGDDPKFSRRARAASVQTAFEAYRDSALRDFTPKWAKKVERLFERFLLPTYGRVELVSLTRAEIRSVTDQLARTQRTTAHQFHRVISAFLSWCVDRDLIQVNVLKGTRLPSRPRARTRVLSDEEIGAVIRSADALPTPWPAYVRLLLLTAQRKNEVLGLGADEVAADLWELPAERTKNRTVSHIPLSRQAREIIDTLYQPGKPLFRVLDRDTPMTFRQAVMDRIRQEAGIPHFTLHDLRRTAASKMAELGVPPHVIEAVLNHRSGVISGVAAIYNRYDYRIEKRDALQRWADRIDEIERDYPDPCEGVEL